MADYFQPSYQPPRPDIYARKASNASVDRYVPENYGGPPAFQPPPPPPPPPGSNPFAARPRGPSLGSQQVPSFPPQPNYGLDPGMNPSNNQLHPSAAAYPPQPPPYPQMGVGADGYMQTPIYPRRHSHSGTHSKPSYHSHRSHQSQDGYLQTPSYPRRHSHGGTHSKPSDQSHHSPHSRQSHDSHRSKHSDHSPERERHSGEHRHSKDSHRSREERDDWQLKRNKTHRPSWGDTVFGIYDVIKDALGPRDKY